MPAVNTKKIGETVYGQCRECKDWFRVLDVCGLCEACGYRHWKPEDDYDRPDDCVEEEE